MFYRASTSVFQTLPHYCLSTMQQLPIPLAMSIFQLIFRKNYDFFLMSPVMPAEGIGYHLFFFHLHIVYSSVHHLKHCFWSYNFSITKYNRHSVWKNFKKLLFLCFFIIVFLFIVLMVSKKKIMKRKFATLLLTISNYLVLERRRVGTSKLFIFINPKKLGGTSNLFSLIILL